MREFHQALLILFILFTVGSLTGCMKTLAQMKLESNKKEADTAHQQWLDSLPERDIITELQENGFANVEFIANDIENALFSLVFSDDANRQVLVDVFHEIHSQKWETAKAEFIAFIQSPVVVDVVIQELQSNSRYADCTPEEMEVIAAAAYLFYEDKVMNEFDEYYVADRLIFVEGFLNE